MCDPRAHRQRIPGASQIDRLAGIDEESDEQSEKVLHVSFWSYVYIYPLYNKEFVHL